METSLERFSSRQFALSEYLGVMRAIRPAAQSWTGKRLDLSDSYISDDSGFPRAPQGYEFMAYLRHHGFPSPLLDWTQSFYIAAFFAFKSAKAEQQDVAIYSFNEYGNGTKEGSGDEATIVGVGPYVTTHERHFRQQCRYTYCSKLLDRNYVYCCHEDAFARGNEKQDILTKFIIPRTERSKVLERLRMMNITAHSLFGTEESMLETLAYQEIETRYNQALRDG